MQFSFSDENIEELRILAEQEFREPITIEEARMMSNCLLQLYELLCAIGQEA